MIEKIYEILADCCPDVDFTRENALVDNGILESLDIVMIVNEFTEAFDVRIGVDDLLPEHFNTPEAMEALIRKLQGDA